MNLIYSNEIKQKIIYLSRSDMADTCQPFFKSCGINYFDYSLVYSDNTGLLLSSNKEYVEAFLENQFAPPFFTYVPLGAHLAKQFLPNKATTCAEKTFKQFNGIVLLRKYDNYIEQIVMTDARKDSYASLNLCCNERQLLTQFISSFRYKARDIIKQCNSDRFVLPKEVEAIEFKQTKTQPNTLDITQAGKVCVVHNSQNIILSRCEYECLRLLAYGKTTKEIAQAFHLSPRTIENHISHMKNKTRCYKTARLKEIFWENF